MAIYTPNKRVESDSLRSALRAASARAALGISGTLMPTFSQRQGYSLLESAFQRESIDSALRTKLWNIHIVTPGTPTIHGQLAAPAQDSFGEGVGSKLATLIRVDNLRYAKAGKRLLQNLCGMTGFQRDRPLPGHPSSTLFCATDCI